MMIIILTGIIVFMISVYWNIIYRLMENRRRPDLVYTLLRCVMAGQILVFVYECVHILFMSKIETNSFMPYTSNVMKAVLIVCLFLWCIGFIVVGISHIPKLFIFLHIYRHKIRTRNSYKIRLANIKAQLGIRRKIRIYESYAIGSPFIFGVLMPGIWVPADNLSDEELDMVITHELLHYKQGDVFFKPAYGILCWFFWFIPYVWTISEQMSLWSEASCDYKCCIDKYDSNTYFTAILELNVKITEYILKLASMWSEGRNELKWRIDCMKKYKDIKIKKATMALITFLVIGTGSVSVVAAENKLVDAYDKIYVGTVTSYEEYTDSDSDDGYVEYTGTPEDLEGYNIIQEEDSDADSGIAPLSTAKNFTWSIPNGTYYISSGFNATQGGSIHVMAAVTPSDKQVKVGIIQPDGSMRYVAGTDTIYHQFSVNQTGLHKVYIFNNSGVSVSVTGMYTY